MAPHDDAARPGISSGSGGHGLSSDAGGPGTSPARGRERPIHLRPSSMLLVFLGGAAGVSAREALVLAFPTAHGFPWAVLGINVTGAFLLGLLLDALARSGPDRGARRAARLGLGTGLIGGYTTYSALAADAAQLIGSGPVGAGIAYAMATLLLGGIATGLGVAAATLVRRSTTQGRDGASERVGASETGEGRS
ncbi:fluoride efflux transporter FluC [Rothia halotolerans]|uniref:fluoride efflux transporter FluC n=1 Tax=Rothia halotolerans TaxID=405770 RepID=UPI001EDFFF52|nr:CrcB family protein [Rothia halotolerans]